MDFLASSEWWMSHALEIAGTLVGIVYLILEYRASIYLWIAGIIMPAISLYVYLSAGLYADFGINVYYLLAAIYGLLFWSMGNKKSKVKKDVPIIHTPLKLYAPLGVTFAVVWVGIYFILINFTNSTVPGWDSFTTALSIVAMWMLARKHLEQWLAWILVDAVSAGLYVYKGIPFYAALYALYTLVAVFGYYKWKRLMKMQNHL